MECCRSLLIGDSAGKVFKVRDPSELLPSIGETGNVLSDGESLEANPLSNRGPTRSIISLTSSGLTGAGRFDSVVPIVWLAE